MHSSNDFLSTSLWLWLATQLVPKFGRYPSNTIKNASFSTCQALLDCRIEGLHARPEPAADCLIGISLDIVQAVFSFKLEVAYAQRDNQAPRRW